MLMRDHATTQESYESLLAKQDLASASVEPAGAGASLLFTIAEPAQRAPLAPFAPRRGRFVLMGLFAGLGLGSLIAFGAEQLNTSFQDSEQFAAFSSLPVLAERSGQFHDSERQSFKGGPRRYGQSSPLR